MGKRNVSLDYYRILSMFLIVLLHSIDHSGVLQAADNCGGVVDIYVRSIYMMTMICVNSFVLISGYFLTESSIRVKKLIALWIEVVFYSIIIKFIFMVIGKAEFSLLSLGSCFFPVITGRYWFITMYFGLYLLSPFLNIAIHAMNKKQHTMLNIVLFILFSVIVSFYPNVAGMNSGNGWGLTWFVVLYIYAAWVRKYYEPSSDNMRLKLMLWSLLSIIIAVLYCTVGQTAGIVRSIVGNWYRYDSVPSVIFSLLVFSAFLDWRKGTISKFLAMVAPATLGVYLIHAHANFSPWIWEMSALEMKINEIWFPLYQIAFVVALFIICALIDIVRKKIFEKIGTAPLVAKLSENIETRFEKCLNLMK